jgi:hypothetical protein
MSGAEYLMLVTKPKMPGRKSNNRKELDGQAL